MAGRSMIQLTSSGSTKGLEKFLKMAGRTEKIMSRLQGVGDAGVAALAAATPKDTALTSGSWSYKIIRSGDGLSIEFHNSNMNQGKNIAVLIRYGHGTRNGGYVPPNDFITPALEPIFEKIKTEAWKAVTSE
jgi:hypothetical protein